MTYYTDVSDKVRNLLDKGYYCDVPLTFSLDSQDAFSYNFSHKSEFTRDEKGALQHAGEYEFTKSTKNSESTFTMSDYEASVNLSYKPKKFSKLFKIDSLNASWTAKKDLLVPTEAEDRIRMFERPSADPLPILSINGEYEAKFRFGKKLFNDLKIIWDHHSFPKLNASMLYNWNAAFLGATISMNNKAFKKVEFLEFMFGVYFNKACLAYVKNSRDDIRDVGKIAFGLYLLSKLKKGNSKTKEDRLEIAIGGEASLDLKDQQLHYEVGTKMTIPEKKVEIRVKMNEKMDCCSSLAIAPKKGIRLIWSEGLNVAGLLANPSTANYKYGFSMEMDFNSLL